MGSELKLMGRERMEDSVISEMGWGKSHNLLLRKSASDEAVHRVTCLPW